MTHSLGTLILVGRSWINLITAIDYNSVQMVDINIAVTLRISPRHARDCTLVSRIFEEAFDEV